MYRCTECSYTCEFIICRGVFLTSPLIGTLSLTLVTPLSIGYSIVVGKVRVLTSDVACVHPYNMHVCALSCVHTCTYTLCTTGTCICMYTYTYTGVYVHVYTCTCTVQLFHMCPCRPPYHGSSSSGPP